ncbi:MAG: hypothetical protein QOE41_3020 [Mycobacterium sp.]|nr:hypothetical protein [Mycobacterium sp.]
MSTFNELPVHVLLVHFIVVLAPLTALLARRPRHGGSRPGPVGLQPDGRAPRLAAAHPRPRGSTRAAHRFGRCCRRDAARSPMPNCRRRDCQYVDTALRRIDELSAEIEPLRTQLVNFARRQRPSASGGPPTTCASFEPGSSDTTTLSSANSGSTMRPWNSQPTPA